MSSSTCASATARNSGVGSGSNRLARLSALPKIWELRSATYNGFWKRLGNETAGPNVERRLKAQAYDCVVIGAGIRLPPHSLSMFEAVINAVHRAAPDAAAIAFNTRPEDSADAAARWLNAD